MLSFSTGSINVSKTVLLTVLSRLLHKVLAWSIGFRFVSTMSLFITYVNIHLTISHTIFIIINLGSIIICFTSCQMQIKVVVYMLETSTTCFSAVICSCMNCHMPLQFRFLFKHFQADHALRNFRFLFFFLFSDYFCYHFYCGDANWLLH